MDKVCPEHGAQTVQISANLDWYEKIRGQDPSLDAPKGNIRPVQRGCPHDCGPCEDHQQRLHLPVVPITSACNLDCPICYTHNRNEDAYHMSAAELRRILEQLRVMAPDQRIINITGGEPTIHPQLLDLLRLCREEGIHRVTISTHGMKFLHDDTLLEAFAELDVRVILSFDSFEQEANVAMLGGQFLEPKLKVLDRLERFGINTSLLPVLARGQNDHEVARFVELALERDFIRSVEFHPMTFTGQSGVDFDRDARYDTYSVLADLEAASKGAIRVDDFVAAPVAHPHCYVVTYLLRLADGRWIPFTRFMGPDRIRRLLRDGLYLEPSVETDREIQDVITQLWAEEIQCEDREMVLAALRAMIDAMADARENPMAVAERYTKAVYVHTHMDEETFDVERIRQCCIGMPDAHGRNIPSCAYNVLYRQQDARFVPSDLVQIAGT